MVQFNKMFVMLPVMFAARKLDGEDPNIVNMLRIAYAVMQVVCVSAVLYVYLKAQAIKDDKVVYVPPAATPFADPNAKKKYTEVAYGAHVVSTARSLVGSTLFGVALTVGLHVYKGMVVGLAIQTVMGPLNLAENALVKALFLGQGIAPEHKIFDEKTADDLTPDDEVVDGSGNIVVRNAGTAVKDKETKKSLEDILLDTWDAGAKADLGSLMEALNKKNCNYQTKADHWTPIMILAGLGAKGTASAIRAVLDMGANPAVVDVEGWNALHWAAFHNSAEGARALTSETQLLKVQDKEGNTPVETARKEGNDEVANIFEAALGENKKSK
jgi:hypothetical protein